MEATNYLAYLDADSGKLADAARKGLEAPVPSCPDWKVADLVGHIGGVQRWVTEILNQRAQEFLDAFPETPPDDALVDWFVEGTQGLLAALRSTPPDTEVWNFSSAPNRAEWWSRRQALETVVHRWDAQGAHGTPEPIPDELAADGIDELLMLFVSAAVESGRGPAPTGSMHVHLTDRPGEWFGSVTDGAIKMTREHAKGDVAVRGPAHDVYLFLWRRQDATGLDIIGDSSVVDTWRIKI